MPHTDTSIDYPVDTLLCNITTGQRGRVCKPRENLASSYWVRDSAGCLHIWSPRVVMPVQILQEVQP